MQTSTLTTLAAVILIGAGGFLAGRISSKNPAAADGTGPAGRTGTTAAGQAAGGATAGASKAGRPARPARAAVPSAAERLRRLENIVRGENPLDRNRALLAFIDQLGPNDFEGAIAQFRALGITESRMGEYALLLTAWAGADPLAALAYAQANTGTPFATQTILSAWASKDPESAIRWAESQHQGEGANPFLAPIIRSIVSSDPARATQLLTSMPRSQERGEALDAMMPYLLTQGAAATRSWIADLTDDSLRDAAMMRAASDLALNDPAGTATWLAAAAGTRASQTRMDDVYAVWAEKDRQAAIGSLTALPAGETRSNALRGLVSQVAVTDPPAALSMMNRFPNDVTDRVVQQFVWHSFGTDPGTAVTQIARIEDEGQRNQMYQRVVGSWLDRDPTAANNWLRANPLPAAVQNQLAKPH